MFRLLLPVLLLTLAAGACAAPATPAGDAPAAAAPASTVAAAPAGDDAPGAAPVPDPLTTSLGALQDLLEQRAERRAALKALRRELAKPREDSDSVQIAAAIAEIEAAIED
ncbi:MAG: hypothetical protein RLW62_01715, partial [Gammaproteobacteria bacterium]